MTTTSSGAGAVEEWFSWWLADWGMRRPPHRPHAGRSLPSTSPGRAPARCWRSVTDARLLQRGVPVPRRAGSAQIAGVPCLILRIGFVGELGYEIHCPSAHGEHLWDALAAAGAEFGLRPFGLEPQRILRLQKMHVIVGQDTDSESTPYSAAHALDRQARQGGRLHRQLGARALLRRARRRPGSSASDVRNGHVPTEGAVIVDERGMPAGQVTSARRSPALDQVIGLAWVPDALAREGSQLTISDEGRRAARTGAHPALLRPRGRAAARMTPRVPHDRRGARRLEPLRA